MLEEPTVGSGAFQVPTSFASANPRWCWTGVDGQAIAIGLSTHELHVGPPQLAGGNDAVLWHDEVFAIGGIAREVVRSDGRGTTSSTQILSENSGSIRGVSIWNGMLALPTREALLLFEEPSAVEANDPIRLPWSHLFAISRVSFSDGLAYGAWHSTDEIVVYAVPDAQLIRTIPLEGFDGRVQGIHVFDDRIYLLHTWTDTVLHVFDLEGNRLDEFQISTERGQGGLWCDTVE